jgi:hypothetical protein
MPVINGIYLKDFTALPGAVADANIIPIAITGDQVAYRTTVAGIITDARITGKLLTGLSVTGNALVATDTILQAFGKVQNQINGKQGTITLTTIGSSGASSLIGNTLNIPNYGNALSNYVPYFGATANLDLGTFDITTDIVNLNQLKAVGSGGLNIYSNSGTHIALMGGGGGAGTTFYGGIIGTSASFSSSGSSDTVGITHSSGSGIALNITKGGNGEGLYINKTSGSGNAATIIGTLEATTLVKSGGTSSQFLKADGSIDSNSYALASALSAYLPLSGGTLTGALGGTSATFSGDVTGGRIFSSQNNALIQAYDASTSGGSATVRAYSGTNYADFYMSNSSGSILKIGINGSDKLSLDNSGNLGLGVTPSAWVSGSQAFESSTYALSLFGYTRNAYFNGTTWIYVANGFATRYAQFESQHLWYNAPSGTAGNAISFTQAMTLDASGRLGIGTTSPGVKLQSNISTSGLPVTSGTTQTNGALRLSSAATSGIIDFGINSSNNWIQSTDSGDLSQSYNLLLNPSGGNVGIGTTSPTSKLQVVGLPEYATNELAITGGLTVGAFYHTAGVLKVVI